MIMYGVSVGNRYVAWFYQQHEADLWAAMRGPDHIVERMHVKITASSEADND